MSDVHPITLYNTRTRQKEPFVPIDPARVRMYVCGPTVYDFAHIGNARPAIVFDVLFRLLQQVYGRDGVTYVRNITDVDDKINERAALDYPDLPLNAAIGQVTGETAEQYRADVQALGCLDPTVEPRATDNIEQMIALAETLIEKGHAYEANGHVLFHVPSDPAYGQLAKRALDEMRAGARVEVAPYKKDGMDFVLWKPSAAAEPGWESPWGLGRPGWHIECSAMARRFLGDVFDIHGGGIDLVFPHHENEAAQTRMALGVDRMANVWMHNGYLQIEGEKMSKSLGNFFTIRDLLDDWPGDVLRLAMLKTHYRQPIDWTVRGMQEAEGTLRQWFSDWPDPGAPVFADPVRDALADDLNTPKAIAALHALSRSTGKAPFFESLAAFGFTGHLDRGTAAATDDDQIALAVGERAAAREARNWAEADRIRDQLAEKGVRLMDARDPETGAITTTWERTR